MKVKLITASAVFLTINSLNIAAAHAATSHRNSSAQTTSATGAKHLRITKSEAKAAGWDRLTRNFDRIDANKDGVVTRNELRAYAMASRPHVPMT